MAIRMICVIIAVLALLLSCSKPMPTNRVVSGLSSESGDCPCEFGARYLHIDVAFDECPMVFQPVYDNVKFWGDSAVVILNKIKHNESTLVCIPGQTLDIFTKYSIPLDSVQHAATPAFTVYAQIDCHYNPTEAQRDTVVARCNKAIWTIHTLQQDVQWHLTGYTRWQREVIWSTDGGF